MRVSDVIKLLISVGVIVFCTQIGRKLPTLAGLIAVMPLTGLIVLLWLCIWTTLAISI